MLRSSLDQQWGLAASLDRSFKHRRKVLAIHICGGDRSKSGMLVVQCLDGCSHSSRHRLLPAVINVRWRKVSEFRRGRVRPLRLLLLVYIPSLESHSLVFLLSSTLIGLIGLIRLIGRNRIIIEFVLKHFRTRSAIKPIKTSLELQNIIRWLLTPICDPWREPFPIAACACAQSFAGFAQR